MMKLKDIIEFICTDEITVCYDDSIEEIRLYEENGQESLQKYFEMLVERIVPTNNAVEIYLK